MWAQKISTHLSWEHLKIIPRIFFTACEFILRFGSRYVMTPIILYAIAILHLPTKYIALPLTSNNHLNNILAINKSQTCKPWIATESELYNKNGTGLVNNLVSHQPNLIPTKHFQSTIHLIWPKVHKVIFDHEACPRRSLECQFFRHSSFSSFFSFSSTPSPSFTPSGYFVSFWTGHK